MNEREKDRKFMNERKTQGMRYGERGERERKEPKEVNEGE